MNNSIEYYCNDVGHVICVPYSIGNLARMAKDLGIPAYSAYKVKDYHYYIIPQKNRRKVMERCNLISPREFNKIIREKLQTYEQASIGT